MSFRATRSRVAPVQTLGGVQGLCDEHDRVWCRWNAHACSGRNCNDSRCCAYSSREYYARGQCRLGGRKCRSTASSTRRSSSSQEKGKGLVLPRLPSTLYVYAPHHHDASGDEEAHVRVECRSRDGTQRACPSTTGCDCWRDQCQYRGT